MQNTIKDIQQLFRDIQNIYPKYTVDRKQPTFNIFSVLEMERDEVYCHSRFIFELLNPRGSHKKGDTFLQLFFNVIEFTEAISSNVFVLKEKQKIDLQIIDSRWAIAVENKIYHYDTEGQILGHYKKLKSAYQNRNVYVLYLSLYGNDPDPKSSGYLPVANSIEVDKVFCISYEKHIKEWIELCIKEVSLEPFMRETFSQYLQLIKYLTGQTMNNEFFQEVKSFLSKKDTFRHISIIQQAAHQIKKDTQLAFWKELSDELISEKVVYNKDSFIVKYNNNLVVSYYDKSRNKPSYYGLSWKLLDIDSVYSVGFKLEINENMLYMGFIPFRV